MMNGSGAGGDSLGIGGGGETMLQHDLGQLRIEIISEYIAYAMLCGTNISNINVF